MGEMSNVYKDYLVLVTQDNEVILDLAIKDPKEPVIIKEGFNLVQSDDPMSVIVNEDGRVYLHE